MRRPEKSRGFTLIEVLIAIVVLSISILGVASLMTTTTKYNASGRQMTEAVTLAQNRLEQLRVSPWANITSGNDFVQMQGTVGITYTRSWNVVPNLVPPDETLRAVTVTVTWNDGVDHSVSFLSTIAR